MTLADRLGFDLCKGEASYLLDNIPGVHPPQSAPIKAGDWVELRFQGNEIDVDVTKVGDTLTGEVRNISSDLAIQLDGLSPDQEITFRKAHIFATI